MTLGCRFWYLYTSNAFIAWWIFHFRVKNCPKMCLEINRSEKRRDIGLVWELLTLGYGLLYEHVDTIGGVTRWGRLSGLKGWNSDNLFDWIDFFKINTYFYFFDERQNVKQKPRIFWKHGVVPFDACSFQLIRTWSVRGACGKKREEEFWSLWILLQKRFYVVWISFHVLIPY